MEPTTIHGNLEVEGVIDVEDYEITIEDDPIDQALVDAAANYDIVKIPAGTYEASSQIKIESRVTVLAFGVTLEATHDDFRVFELGEDRSHVLGLKVTTNGTDGDPAHAIDLTGDHCTASHFSALSVDFGSDPLRSAGEKNSFTTGVADGLADSGTDTITAGVTPLDQS